MYPSGSASASFFSTSSSSSFNLNPPPAASPDRRPAPLGHTASQSSMHGSSFNVAGMLSSSASGHASGNMGLGGWSTGGGTGGAGVSGGAGASTHGHGQFSGSLNEGFSQSRPHYQAGYLISMAPNNSSPQSGQRFDEVPIVQTKAKMNHMLSRGTASDFGTESMFESSSRQRQTLTDEDAPPTNSVNDIVNEVHSDYSPRFQPRNSAFDPSSSRPFQPRQSQSSPGMPSAQSQPLYIIVFGYPPDKYSVTAEYFRSLGDTTEPDPHTEITNCFKIGFKNPGEAMRAVRKNGEILGGSWMVGAKWADAAQAEAILGRSAGRSPLSTPQSPDLDTSVSSSAMAVDDTPSRAHNSLVPASHSFGTPIKLAPSTEAFRKPGSGMKAGVAKPVTPIQGWNTPGTGAASSPTKGVIGQVSDLIFGW